MNNANLLCTFKIWITVSDNQAHSGAHAVTHCFPDPGVCPILASLFLLLLNVYKAFQHHIVICLSLNLKDNDHVQGLYPSLGSD